MSPRQRHRAEVLGEAMRLAFQVSGGAPSVLERSALVVDEDRLSLHLPDDGSSPYDDSVARQLQALAATTGLRPGRILG